jgi:hypothetical protein
MVSKAQRRHSGAGLAVRRVRARHDCAHPIRRACIAAAVAARDALLADADALAAATD